MKAQELLVDGSYFDFPSSWLVTAFDEWQQFRQLSSTGVKGCDVVALDPGDSDPVLWLIEMKDYTYPGAEPPRELPEHIAAKVVGTMGVLYALERSDSDQANAALARDVSAAKRIHVALHIQVNNPAKKNRSIPILLATLKNSIRKHTKAVGITKVFVSSSPDHQSAVPWTARRDPESRSSHLIEKPAR